VKTRVTFSLIFVLSFVAGEAKSAENDRPDDGGVQQWFDKSGRMLEAHFIGLKDSMVIVEEKASPLARHNLPLTKLSPESVALARRMASVVNVYVPVKPGRFDMGSPEVEFGRSEDEASHEVTTRALNMRSTEITWCEWNAVRNFAELYGYLDIGEGNNGTHRRDADLNPVVGITWWDAVKWCNLKSQLEGLAPVYYTDKDCKVKDLFKIGTSEIFVKSWTADGYRLPTEAEWEFACRTRRTDFSFNTGDIERTEDESSQSNMKQAGWFLGNSAGGLHPVAGKRPNTFELYDMHGNAAEWCWNYYARVSSGKDGPLRGDKRVIRGGAWNDSAKDCRSAARASLPPGAAPDRSVGFRPVRK